MDSLKNTGNGIPYFWEGFPTKLEKKVTNIIATKLPEKTITILLENEGWLNKDLTSKNKYINYVGHIYNRTDSVIEKKWRGQKYWAPFTKEQINATVNLTSKLCEQFNIPIKAVSHNTNLTNPYSFKGILYRSNFNKFYTDITPAWDCKEFKNKLEKNEK